MRPIVLALGASLCPARAWAGAVSLGVGLRETPRDAGIVDAAQATVRWMPSAFGVRLSGAHRVQPTPPDTQAIPGLGDSADGPYAHVVMDVWTVALLGDYAVFEPSRDDAPFGGLHLLAGLEVREGLGASWAAEPATCEVDCRTYTPLRYESSSTESEGSLGGGVTQVFERAYGPGPGVVLGGGAEVVAASGIGLWLEVTTRVSDEPTRDPWSSDPVLKLAGVPRVELSFVVTL